MMTNTSQKELVEVPLADDLLCSMKKRRGDAFSPDLRLRHDVGAKRALDDWFIFERRVEDVAAPTSEHFEPADLASRVRRDDLSVLAVFFPLREDVEGPAVLPDASYLLGARGARGHGHGTCHEEELNHASLPQFYVSRSGRYRQG